MAFAGVLRRVWIPLIVLAVVGAAAFSVVRIRAAPGFDKHPPYEKSEIADTGKLGHKSVVYEVFGSPGAVADISYLDVNADPKRVGRARLPWSMQMTTKSAAVLSSVVAQGDSDSIGCRIVIDGRVKAERISNEVSAFTFCQAKGA